MENQKESKRVPGKDYEREHQKESQTLVAMDCKRHWVALMGKRLDHRREIPMVEERGPYLEDSK